MLKNMKGSFDGYLDDAPDFFLEEGEDPINRLGYGIISYFSLIKTLMQLYFVLTLVNLPTILEFQSFSAYEGENMSFLTKFTLGNMGESKTKCIQLEMLTD